MHNRWRILILYWSLLFTRIKNIEPKNMFSLYVELNFKSALFITSFCWFNYPDVTPPTCSFCPGDIVREVPNAYERVSWKDPKCSDNSNVPAVITSNYPNGRLFKVPGTYKVQYFVTGKKGDVYKGCSFNITLTCKLCLPFTRCFN